MQWVKPWLERIKVTNAYVASAAYTTIPPDMKRFHGINGYTTVVDTWDIWRMVR